MPEDLSNQPVVRRETPTEAREVDKMVGRLSLVVFLEWMGAGAVLPLLPLYLKNHGASSARVYVICVHTAAWSTSVVWTRIGQT